MRLLLLTHRVPYPPNRGDRIRSYQLLKYLAERADVSLACTADEPVEAETFRHLQPLCERLAICPTTRVGRTARAGMRLAHGRSATEGHFWSARLARTVQDWNREQRFDAVVCYCSSMYSYVRDADMQGARLIVDLVDVDSRKWLECARKLRGPMRWIYRLESARVQMLEGEIAARSQAITIVSQTEAELFREVFPDAPVFVVENGVCMEPSLPTKVDGSETCVFVGALDYFPNVDGVTWFGREVWPRVRGRFAAAKFLIVGRNPVREVRRLATNPGVELVGEVSDVGPYLRAARLAVIPLRIARGVQNKVLEAMASATPVIASTSALQGLKVVAGQHVELADSPHDWAGHICRLFQDDQERRRLGRAGYDFIAEHHRWDDCLRPLGQLLGLDSTDMPIDHAATVCAR